jgi:hypothetical protein
MQRRRISKNLSFRGGLHLQEATTISGAERPPALSHDGAGHKRPYPRTGYKDPDRAVRALVSESERPLLFPPLFGHGLLEERTLPVSPAAEVEHSFPRLWLLARGTSVVHFFRSPSTLETTMIHIVERRGASLLLAAGLALVVWALTGPEARCQSSASGGCQNMKTNSTTRSALTTGTRSTGSTGLTGSTSQQISLYQTAVQNALQQLYAAEDNGQLTTSQLATADQQISALENAYQQLNTLQQSGATTTAQVQAVNKQLSAQSVYLRVGRPSRRR